MPLLRNGKAIDDVWAHAPDGVELSPGGCVTVSLGRFLSEHEILLVRNEAIGVRLAPSDDPHLLAPFLDRLHLIEVEFPRYTDGRGYSIAQLLRRRLEFKGELRAVGHVLRDQFAYMTRVGFDELMAPSETAEAEFAEAVGEFSFAYQATADGAPTIFQRRHGGACGVGGSSDPEVRLARLNARYADASAHQIIEGALEEFGRRLAYVSSFGAESAVMLKLIADVDPAMPVLFIDTGMHFQQTLQYRDQLRDFLKLTDIRTIHPEKEAVKAVDPKGQLNKTDPDACCEVRKVAPLEPALEGFDAWITGRKRFHGFGRSTLDVFEFSEGRFKVNPLVNWAQADIDKLLSESGVPRHPLTFDGYTSIGCWPCTQRPETPGDIRSGRWAGRDKSECGLHVERKDRLRVF